MTKTVHRYALLAAVAISAAAAVSNSLGLADYDVPVRYLVSYGLSTLIAIGVALVNLADGLVTTTHRCKVPGCAFKVHVRHTDAVDNRRWQEIAASHPDHDEMRPGRAGGAW